jgi:hypothetical protein
MHGLFVSTFFLTAIGVGAFATFTQVRLESRLQRELGFSHRCESYDLPPVKGHLTEYAAIATVRLDGAMDRAGFQPDDILLYDGQASQLFQMLARRRGQSVELTVIRPIASQPLIEKCPRLVLTLELPP